MSEQANRENEGGLPFPGPEPKFRGFPEFRSNVLYCPKQFFTVVVPHSSVNCIRVVSYMLRKTLGWVNEAGDPIREQHEFAYRDLEGSAGIVHSGLRKGIEEALKYRFIRCVQKARIQSQGVRARSAAYELLWNESAYTDDPIEFRGFYLQPSYTDRDGQNRIGRKNIPNIFFDYLVKNENRRVIRVVGALLWYSIDWGKGGERKQPVQKSLRDLVELTHLDKKNVVRALDEAQEKGYVERLERGVFDLTGKGKSTATVYGIHWTNEYTYTYDGLPVAVSDDGERSKKAPHLSAVNAPKKPHGLLPGTLQKRHTDIPAERSKKAPRNAPEKPPEERSKKATLVITKTDIPNTPMNSSSTVSADSPAPAAAVRIALLKVGFDDRTAQQLAGSFPGEVILAQIEYLPKRRASKNPLGMLRKAIQENWGPPLETQTTDVGSSAGGAFAANFYAGYHGNEDAPVSSPSAADVEDAERFVNRLLKLWPDSSRVANWGRQFGGLVAYRHDKRRVSFPALRAAIQQHGDDFYARLRALRADEIKQAKERARSDHHSRFEAAYLEYLGRELARHQQANSPLYRSLLSQEDDYLKLLQGNRFGLDIEARFGEYQATRLERFQNLADFGDGEVLGFWDWDEKMNAEPFTEANT